MVLIKTKKILNKLIKLKWMQQKNSRRILNIIFLGLSSLIYSSCKENHNRSFFQSMKKSYNDLMIDSTSYFIKGFGLEKNSKKINDNFYWKINCEKVSFFYLTGYIRQKDDSIILIPININNEFPIKEQKLFDFSNPKQEGWSLCLEAGKISYCDSVYHLNTSSQNGYEPVYTFAVIPFYYYQANNSRRNFDYWFKVKVSKLKGIIDITTLYSNPTDTLYYCSFYPNETIIDRTGGKLRL